MKKDLYSIKLDNETIVKVAIADTDKSLKAGLADTPSLGKDKGMLFMFPKPYKINMIMRDMNYPLDFIFLNEKFEITQLGSLEKDSEEGITSNYDVPMVLEVNQGFIKDNTLSVGLALNPEIKLLDHFSGVKKYKKGGSFEKIGDVVYAVKETDIKADPNKMQILDEGGKVVANIDDGARIYSREHTKELYKLLRKGNSADLAKFVIKVVDIQDNQEPEYVTK